MSPWQLRITYCKSAGGKVTPQALEQEPNSSQRQYVPHPKGSLGRSLPPANLPHSGHLGFVTAFTESGVGFS